MLSLLWWHVNSDIKRWQFSADKQPEPADFGRFGAEQISVHVFTCFGRNITGFINNSWVIVCTDSTSSAVGFRTSVTVGPRWAKCLGFRHEKFNKYGEDEMRIISKGFTNQKLCFNESLW